MIRARRRRIKTQSGMPKKTGNNKEKKSSKASIKEDIIPYLSISETNGFAHNHEGSPLPEVSVPSPDDAALPKPSLCSLNEKETDSIVPLNCDACNPMAINENEGKKSGCVFVVKSPLNKSGKNKKKEQVQSHQLTEYFPIRRSNRKPLCSVKKEKQEIVENAIISGKEDGFEIKEFPEKGRGVITKKNVKRGDFVLEYAGELIDVEEAKRRERLYAVKKNTGCYMYYFKHANRQYCIDATKESGRLGRLVNHSKKGNLKTQSFLIKNLPHLILVACRDISAGEELLYDYGDRSKESLEAHPWLAL